MAITPTNKTKSTAITPTNKAVTLGKLLLETGDYILLENSGKIILDSSNSVNTTFTNKTKS